MFWKIETGTNQDIQGLVCWTPPVGYVVNMTTGKLEHRGVHSRSDIPEQQYWERVPLPSWYKTKIKEEDNYERKRKDNDLPFYDEQLEKYKQQEWDRRLNGFWFMNNGVPTYIDGAHYVYLQWFQIDIGYPKFRIPDLEYFYFIKYCIEDPDCMGAIELTKRRFGKSFRCGLFLYEYVTRTRNAYGGIQSKTGGDAKKLFGKAVITPFKKLPRFFRPEYDMSLGITPKTEIRFQQTNVRGKKAEESLDKEELGSMIDWQSADEVAYDGQKLHRYVADEAGKTVECNIYDRHDVIRYCLLDDEGRIIGKALYTTTVEKLDTDREGIQQAFKQLWDDSDQLNKKENGRTPSGLYRFFMTADRAKNFDIYGFPNVEKTIKDILSDRESVKHNPRALSARIRKEARTVEEAFNMGNEFCEFNELNIVAQKKELKENPPILRKCRMNLLKEKIKGPYPGAKEYIKRKITTMEDANGGWVILEPPSLPNAFEDRNGILAPQNRLLYQIGVDTTKDMPTENGSKPVIVVFKKSLIVKGVEMGMYPVAMWISDTRLDIHFDEEVLKACMWYGCTANYEIDARADYYRYFCKMDAREFLEWTPVIARNPAKRGFKPEPGTRSGDPFQFGQQLQICKMYVDGTDDQVYNGHVHRIKYLSLLDQLHSYNHADRTKSDQVIALMMALLPVFGDIQMPPPPKLDRSKLLPRFKIEGAHDPSSMRQVIPGISLLCDIWPTLANTG
jgi:hypothetical protein